MGCSSGGLAAADFAGFVVPAEPGACIAIFMPRPNLHPSTAKQLIMFDIAEEMPGLKVEQKPREIKI
jgi:hypothetical protein